MLVALNLRTGAPLADRARVTRGAWDRLRGLLGRPRLDSGEALLIRPCNGIHTVGMAYPIDVVFIDRVGRVIRAERAVPPLRFIPLVRRAASVLELPEGAIDASGTRCGDVLWFTEVEP
jgi:uncharacterized membrane protein (UPF0127 family)